MTSKITIRIDDETRRALDCGADALKLSVSEYVRGLIDGSIADATIGCLPPALRSIVSTDVEHGYYRDGTECMIHYIREGMRAEGRLPIPAEVPE